MTFLTFTFLLCLWALACVAMYTSLRAFGERFRLAMCVFGSLSLGFWTLALAALAFLASLSWDDPAPSSYEYALVLGVSAGLLLTLVIGGALVRAATDRQLIWWHGVLFCSLYLALTHALCLAVAVKTGAGYHFSDLWWKMLLALNIPMSHDFADGGSSVLFWLFPLGAPLFEIIFNSFKRAHQTNKSGSFI